MLTFAILLGRLTFNACELDCIKAAGTLVAFGLALKVRVEVLTCKYAMLAATITFPTVGLTLMPRPPVTVDTPVVLCVPVNSCVKLF